MTWSRDIPGFLTYFAKNGTNSGIVLPLLRCNIPSYPFQPVFIGMLTSLVEPIPVAEHGTKGKNFAVSWNLGRVLRERGSPNRGKRFQLNNIKQTT